MPQTTTTPHATTAPTTRLPQRPHTGGRRVGAGLTALLGSLVLIVGVPVGLVAFVGNPLPTTMPTRAWLTAEVTATLVIDVLAVLVWVVWVHFLVCFLTEWRAVRAGRMPERVVLGGGSQVLARQLVAGILLLAGGASAAHGATALTADVPPSTGTAAVASAGVGELRPPLMSPEDRAAVVGEARDRPAQAGRAVKHYEVKPPRGRNHDTLWDIAERTLGDPLRYKEIFALNRHRLQPDGSRLTDADLIRPGWQLRLPPDASGPGVRLTPEPAAPVPRTPEARTTGGEAGGAAVDPGTVPTALGGVVAESTDPSATVEPAQSSDERGGLAELLLGGGLVLAGVARALTARRGPFGEPDAGAVDLARVAAMRRAELLDHALRSLAGMRTAQNEPMPEVLFVYAGDDQVVLHLAERTTAPEPPWKVSEDGSSWSLHADELVPPDAGVPAPYPSLVAVGQSHGFDLLIDLEMAPGLVTLGGHTQVAREVAMSMALDLATHTWSDAVDVVMVGFGDQLGDLGTGRVRHFAHLDDVIAESEQGTATFGRVARELGLDGVLQGRLRGAAREATPTVVVLSGPPTAEQAQRMSRLTGDGRTAFAVVAVGDSPSARWRVVVDSAGSLEVGVLGISGTARRLSPAGQQHLEDLLAAAVERRAAGEALLETTPAQELATQMLREKARGGEPDRAPGDVTRPGSGITPTRLATAPASVRLMGPVAVQAPGHVDEARRDLLTEVVTMVALHPDGLHEAVLEASLWPRGTESDVVEARLADAQEWLGLDAEGHPRLQLGADGRWHLSDVAVDLDVVVTAARQGELDDLLAALRLGTGEAFSGAGRHYGWLAFARAAREGRLLITSVARRAAEVAAAHGQEAAVLEALRLGVALVPTAEVLWRTLLRAVSQVSPADMDGEITQMYSVLAQHGVRPEPQTDALVAELVPARGGAFGS